MSNKSTKKNTFSENTWNNEESLSYQELLPCQTNIDLFPEPIDDEDVYIPNHIYDKKHPKHLKHSKLRVFKNISIGITLCILIAISFSFADYCKEQKAIREAHLTEVSNTINVDTFYNGISVCGVDLSGKTMQEAKDLIYEVEPSLRPDMKINIYRGNNIVDALVNDDFDFTYNTDEVLDTAYNTARSGDDENRFTEVKELEKNPINFTVLATLDTDSLDKASEKIAKSVYVPYQNAHFVNFTDGKPTFSEGTNGLKLNTDRFKSDLSDTLKNRQFNSSISVQTKPTEPQIKLSDINTNPEVIASFSTHTASDENSLHNMQVSCEATNSVALLNGETFSFNALTGDTTTATLGYVEAGAISGNKLIKAYGGGICQTATTIYGAALRANMTIVERSNHQWPSTYVPIGQDATIGYPYCDLKFRNDTGSPVYIKMSMNGRTLICEFYGTKSTEYDRIDVVSQKTETIPIPAAQYIQDSSLKSGEQRTEIAGREGSRASGQKIFYKGSSEIKRENILSSYYPAIAPVIRVGN